jgi:hypothetical protein
MIDDDDDLLDLFTEREINDLADQFPLIAYDIRRRIVAAESYWIEEGSKAKRKRIVINTLAKWNRQEQQRIEERAAYARARDARQREREEARANRPPPNNPAMRAEIEAAKTPSGGWTKADLAKWGVPWPPPKGWKKFLENKRQSPRPRRYVP